MAVTYEPIATTTLGSAAATITFSSIPSTYTDLRLVFIGTVAVSGDALSIRFNNDSSTLYSYTILRGNGTTAASSRAANANSIYITNQYGTISNTIPQLSAIDIFSYAGSTNKTFLFNINNDQNGLGVVSSGVGLYRSTSAITTVNIVNIFGNNIGAGSTATLYGIKAA